jgi:hypothetical protein
MAGATAPSRDQTSVCGFSTDGSSAPALTAGLGFVSHGVEEVMDDGVDDAGERSPRAATESVQPAHRFIVEADVCRRSTPHGSLLFDGLRHRSKHRGRPWRRTRRRAMTHEGGSRRAQCRSERATWCGSVARSERLRTTNRSGSVREAERRSGRVCVGQRGREQSGASAPSRRRGMAQL